MGIKEMRKAGDASIHSQARVMFFLSKSSWQEPEERELLARLLPARGVLDNLRHLLFRLPPKYAVSLIERLKRADDAYIFDGNLLAENRELYRKDSEGFDYLWLYHDTIAYVEILYKAGEVQNSAIGRLPPCGDETVFGEAQGVDSMGEIICDFQYSPYPLAGGESYRSSTGKNPYGGENFHLFQNSGNPRKFVLNYLAHDPNLETSAGLFFNHLLPLFCCTAKILYYHKKLGVDSQAAGQLPSGDKDLRRVAEEYKVALLPFLSEAVYRCAFEAEEISKRLSLTQLPFFQKIEKECRGFVSQISSSLVPIGLSGERKPDPFEEHFREKFNSWHFYDNFLALKKKIDEAPTDEWYFSALPEMAPHDRHHWQRVYGILCEILIQLQKGKDEEVFNKCEILSLMYAAYLHDIGMKTGASFEGITLSPANYKAIREIHGILSSLEIVRDCDYFHLDRSSAKIVGEIAKRHQRRICPLTGTDGDRKEVVVNIGGKNIKIQVPVPKDRTANNLFGENSVYVRLPLLCAILRICDAADIGRAMVHSDRGTRFIENWRNSLKGRLKDALGGGWSAGLYDDFKLSAKELLAKCMSETKGFDFVDEGYFDQYEALRVLLKNAIDSSSTSPTNDKIELIHRMEYIVYLLGQPVHFKKHDAFNDMHILLEGKKLTLSYHFAPGVKDERAEKEVIDSLVGPENGEWGAIKDLMRQIGIEELIVQCI